MGNVVGNVVENITHQSNLINLSPENKATEI